MIRGGAKLSKTKPNQILFQICEQPPVSWGSCRVLSQLDKCTAASAALNGQSEIETEPTRGCHLTFNPSHKTLLLLLNSSSPDNSILFFVKPKFEVQVQSPKVKTKRTWADTKITWATLPLIFNHEGVLWYKSVKVSMRCPKLYQNNPIDPSSQQIIV